MAAICVGVTMIDDLSSAVGLGTLPAGTLYARVQADVQAVRYWQDGSTPTASEGILLAAGSSATITGILANFQAIQTTSGAKLQVEFFSS